jgi:SNF2 family DNA or RNA helicase
MILKLRMFNSHILAAQDVVQSIFDSEAALGEIATLIDNNMPTTDPTLVIVRLIQGLVKESQDRGPNTTAQPDPTKIMTQFRAFISELKSSENEDQLLLRLSCPVCKSIPTETHVSSCMHLFCEDCLMSLAESRVENTEKGRSSCPACDVPIEEVEPCGSIEGAFLETQPQQAEQPPTQHAMPTKKKNSRLKKHLTNAKKTFGGNPFTNSSGDGDEEDESDEAPDWLATAGHLMPSAKVTQVQDIIRGWLQEAPDTKVVIFTQFRVMAEIFGSMCTKEGWGYGLVGFGQNHYPPLC